LSSSIVTYQRKYKDEKLKKEEIFHIIREKEKECIDKAVKNIKTKT
jgi:hypothetical protein